MADLADKQVSGSAGSAVSGAAGAGEGDVYERRLDREQRWALAEGSRHFEGNSAVHAALRKITAKLEELGIPYAVAGGMSLFAHGFRRFTEDVDILVSREGLQSIHRLLTGRGYRPPFEGSKNLRDTEFGVRIEFLIAGQFPGDGKPKPVAFPDPADVAEDRAGIQYLALPALVELKLASGMTSPGRIRDLADVQELIRLLDLGDTFADRLSPFVRGRYAELWAATRAPDRRYLRIWRDETLTADIRSFEDLAAALPRAADELQAMQTDGVVLDAEAGGVGRAVLVTSDPRIAAKYGMHGEDEFWTEDPAGEDAAGGAP